MPVDRNRSRLVWSVLTYHPHTYTHSASAVMQQPVSISYHIIRAVSRTPASWQVAKYDSRPKYQNLYNEFVRLKKNVERAIRLHEVHGVRNAGK